MLRTKSEILEILEMPDEVFYQDIAPKAKALHKEQNGNRLIGVAMLGYDNVCKNNCLYCGMRAKQPGVVRYRMTPDEVVASVSASLERGFQRVFLVAGEDPAYGFDNLLDIVRRIKEAGAAYISLAVGEFEKSQYLELQAAGCSEYVLKFEMGQREIFNRLNPSTDYDVRMGHIREIKELGLDLATGNIIDYPGQTLEMMAEDIMLMQDFEITWAPSIPYLPAKGTPLAEEGGRGSLVLLHKELAILRLSMPDIRVTAQQPGENLMEGLASNEGNLAALAAGADTLFCDLLTEDKVKSFSVVDNRITLGLEHIQEMAQKSGMQLTMF